MQMYAPLVSVGSYLLVQDSNINGHPVHPHFAGNVGGPWEAIEDFLETTDDFVIDKEREQLLMTFMPNGFLRRVK